MWHRSRMHKTLYFGPLFGVAAGSFASAASAQSVTLRPIEDARMRYEHVEIDGAQDTADALTIRLRTGIEATRGRVAALVEGEGTLAIIDHYDDNVSGPSRYAAVGDPQTIALYRAQVRYASDAVTVTAGRQRIALDDERFVGVANFRQNGRSYDAARAEVAVLPGLRADVSYAWSVRTPTGINGSGARPQAIGGGNVFAHLAWQAPVGTISGFAYLVDQDEVAVQGFRLSSQSYGVRWTGEHRVGRQVVAHGTLSYATQSDYGRNPNDYRASYYIVEGKLDVTSAKLRAGYEVLGASRGAALTSFQTPLAAAFGFQGWADRFTTTPPNGVRDLYASAGWTWRTAGPFRDLLVQAVHHRFRSDRLDQGYGHETDLLASMKWRRHTLSARYANYTAEGFSTDTRKVWLELAYAL